MVDRQALRAIIAQKPAPESLTTVSRRWLEEVANDLDELAALRAAEEPEGDS